MKKLAEDHLGHPIIDAVVTVPAGFTMAQRQAIKVAGEIAGLKMLCIIDAPTAAAITYGLDKPDQRIVLIFDLGGGTVDVSILEMKAVAGDNHLGGEDFDQHMVNHFVQKFKDEHKTDLKTTDAAMWRLRIACEDAKRDLSDIEEADIDIRGLYERIDFSTTITRTEFDMLNQDLFLAALDPIREALKLAKMKKSAIDEIVLFGGSTRISKIQQLLRNFFDGKASNKNINWIEAAASGAAVQASFQANYRSNVDLFNITSRSISIEPQNGFMSVLISRGTRVPITAKKTYTNRTDNVPAMLFRILENSSGYANKYIEIGHFFVSNLPPMLKNDAKIEITFRIDTDGFLHVTAAEVSSGISKDFFIQNISTYSAKGVEEMKKKNNALCLEQEQTAKAKNALSACCSKVMEELRRKDLKRKISDTF